MKDVEVDDRILCWFSCGVPSAVAAKKTIELYGATNEVLVVNCDTRPSEHSDNYRFSSEVEAWLGQSITYIRNSDYQTVDDVFEHRRYMSGVKGAPCTNLLKKVPRIAFADPDDIHVFGFTATGRERKRALDFETKNPELYLLFTLIDQGLTTKNCHEIIAQANISPPAMYQLGFDNNNCPGCVKASSPWYWDMVRTHFPEVFARRCEQSRRIGCRLVEIRHHVRIFLDELPPGPFKRRKKKENLSCGPECGVPVTL